MQVLFGSNTVSSSEIVVWTLIWPPIAMNVTILEWKKNPQNYLDIVAYRNHTAYKLVEDMFGHHANLIGKCPVTGYY